MSRLGRCAAAAIAALCGGATVCAQSVAHAEVRIDGATQGGAPQPYVVLLKAAPLAAVYGETLARGGRLSEEEQRTYLAGVRAAQAELMTDIAALGGVEIARTSIALNALFVSCSQGLAVQIAALPDVRGVQVVVNFRTEAGAATEAKSILPFVGADIVRASGRDGTGVKVAVLDSGIDYTHAAFGGAGTLTAYLSAYGSGPGSPQNRGPVSWPQGKVVDGYDFVGERWPHGPLAPDPNPIAAPPAVNDLGIVGTDGGHGTSVADIIAGGPYREQPDNHGLAPGVSLYAVKVCSALGTSCSGIALIQGIDWSLDPDGDGSLADAVDVINLSVGSYYGRKDNPSSEAVGNAVRAGVVVCCAAGNAGDNPYIVSSPASAPGAIAVAETTMPDSKVFSVDIVSPALGSRRLTLSNTAALPWAPISGQLEAALVRPPNRSGCAPFPPGSLRGKIALIDRGTCNVSFKACYAQAAGAVGVLIVNDAPGDPTPLSFGGLPLELEPSFTLAIPVVVLAKTDGEALLLRLAQGEALNAAFSEMAFVTTASSVAAGSSRGPGLDGSTIKPEIAAPGASLAAVAGSGNRLSVFGGTSGAAPVLAGAAALIRQVHPGLPPLEVKALLMNHADSATYQNRASAPHAFSPISRTGAGEVRVHAALEGQASAWGIDEAGVESPALSFGFHRFYGVHTLSRRLRVKNYAGVLRTFRVSTESRSSPGAAGAVVLRGPTTVQVPARGSAEFEVQLAVDAAKLPVWNTDSGAYGADGARLGALEYGGFVALTEGAETLRLPWHLLPQRSHRAFVAGDLYRLGAAPLRMTNRDSSIAAEARVFALTGTSSRLAPGSYPAVNDGRPPVDLQHVGVRLADTAPGGARVLEFALTTYEPHTHANFPAQFAVNIDVNNDGLADWSIFNQRASSTDWRNVTYLKGAAWDRAYATFYTDVDFNSTNVVLRVPLDRIGLTMPDEPSETPVRDPMPVGHAFTFSVQAFDNYFTGLLMDEVGPMSVAPDAPRFTLGGSLGKVTVPAGGGVDLPIGGTTSVSSPSQSGLLLLFDRARAGYETKALRVVP